MKGTEMQWVEQVLQTILSMDPIHLESTLLELKNLRQEAGIYWYGMHDTCTREHYHNERSKFVRKMEKLVKVEQSLDDTLWAYIYMGLQKRGYLKS